MTSTNKQLIYRRTNVTADADAAAVTAVRTRDLTPNFSESHTSHRQ